MSSVIIYRQNQLFNVGRSSLIYNASAFFRLLLEREIKNILQLVFYLTLKIVYLLVIIVFN